ncbi:AAA family ATPase [Gemella morbillorum]|uniref:AAA family ATPase n=1 Tax=Gemella morbillorum TaxID=29391 RepID=UPI00254A5794|nr:AAA family ATPase [Gemella morbillorum]MDK8238861.1 AAA family ATPase [Gemella morbillorum]MDK8254179.1 AAA family ATPase [Gemella morbillorum]
MIKSIEFIQYRKLKNISFEFEKGVNIISGTNGTCKSSLLHIISNSFQKVKENDTRLKNNDSLKIIKNINKLTNPKIESLTKGDKIYNDPASGYKGTLFKCNYLNDTSLEFRRHNVKKNYRFAVKPRYKNKGKESLPCLPVIYLGLFRLFALGEFSDNEKSISKFSTNTSKDFKKDLENFYFGFTNYNLTLEDINSMGNIKNRIGFNTDKDGIDSNTISAGEDNLLIILTALLSLKYYYNNLNNSNQDVESILLIDEFDASLHPEFQIKLYEICKEYSQKYKIQIFFTSHSLSLIEYALNKKNNSIFYLRDDIDSVGIVDDLDIYKIKMLLNNKTKKEVYLNNKIPIITEDFEARTILNLLLEYYSEKFDTDLKSIFHVVDANLSSEAIKTLTKDDYLLRSTLRTVNILDGDKHNEIDLNKHLMTLPGKKNPEELVFQYSKYLANNNKVFFTENKVLENEGYTLKYFQTNILKKIESIDEEIQKLEQQEKTKKGKKRELNKQLFNEFPIFWKFVIKEWINDDNNKTEVDTFFKNLHILFCKTSDFHGVNRLDWKITGQK